MPSCGPARRCERHWTGLGPIHSTSTICFSLRPPQSAQQVGDMKEVVWIILLLNMFGVGGVKIQRFPLLHLVFCWPSSPITWPLADQVLLLNISGRTCCGSTPNVLRSKHWGLLKDMWWSVTVGHLRFFLVSCSMIRSERLEKCFGIRHGGSLYPCLVPGGIYLCHLASFRHKNEWEQEMFRKEKTFCQRSVLEVYLSSSLRIPLMKWAPNMPRPPVC